MVRQYINFKYTPAWDEFYECEIEQSYLASMGETLEDSSIERTVTSDGNVSEWRHRFRELMDVCVGAFKDDMVSTLRSFREKKETIVSVNVVDYDKYKISVIVKTKVPKNDRTPTASSTY